MLCRQAAADGLDVSIVRPRTILGHGRLGLMAILFELVAEGAPVFVFDGGHNRYQLVHADDLADACLRAGAAPGPARLQHRRHRVRHHARDARGARATHAGTGRRVRSVPSAPARLAMRALSAVGQGPFAPYHWLLYGESLWFDTTAGPRRSSAGRPSYSNASMVIESYRWFLAHRDDARDGTRSHHQSPVRMGALRLLRRLP